MRLLNTSTYDVRDFTKTEERPPYAILSHVWGEGEVNFNDMQDLPTARKRKGWHKVASFCARAKQDGYAWVWDDTCCIDKSNNTEFSEAINSMYAWYAEAEVCYAYLQDVNDPSKENPAAEDSSFRRSRWFTRGWTLQELIAPTAVYLLSTNWVTIGTKQLLASTIQEITNVDREVLMHTCFLEQVSVARRMSWAAERFTTKIEDRAYSLLGIFGVNMPTIYGEGDKAFIRLQLEIIRQTPDHSIFAWGVLHTYDDYENNFIYTKSVVDDMGWASAQRVLLAPSPNDFKDCANIESFPIEQYMRYAQVSVDVPEFYPTNYGIHIHLPLYHDSESGVSFGLLACLDSSSGHPIALLLRPQGRSLNRYYIGMWGTSRPPIPPHFLPWFRTFAIPPQKYKDVTVTRLYLHSHNPNFERSKRQGIAQGQLLQRSEDGHPSEGPRRFSFVFYGWHLAALRRARYSPAGYWDNRTSVVGWTPSTQWRRDEGVGLVLSLKRSGDIPSRYSLSSSHGSTIAPDKQATPQYAVIVFSEESKGPGPGPDKAYSFAVIIGLVPDTAVVWSTVIFKDDDNSVWQKADDNAVAKAIWTSIASLAADPARLHAKGFRLDGPKWKDGMTAFQVARLGTVKITYTPFVTLDQAASLGHRSTMTYAVELAISGA